MFFSFFLKKGVGLFEKKYKRTKLKRTHKQPPFSNNSLKFMSFQAILFKPIEFDKTLSRPHEKVFNELFWKHYHPADLTQILTIIPNLNHSPIQTTFPNQTIIFHSGKTYPAAGIIRLC